MKPLLTLLVVAFFLKGCKKELISAADTSLSASELQPGIHLMSLTRQQQ